MSLLLSFSYELVPIFLVGILHYIQFFLKLNDLIRVVLVLHCEALDPACVFDNFLNHFLYYPLFNFDTWFVVVRLQCVAPHKACDAHYFRCLLFLHLFDLFQKSLHFILMLLLRLLQILCYYFILSFLLLVFLFILNSERLNGDFIVFDVRPVAITLTLQLLVLFPDVGELVFEV